MYLYSQTVVPTDIHLFNSLIFVMGILHLNMQFPILNRCFRILLFWFWIGCRINETWACTVPWSCCIRSVWFRFRCCNTIIVEQGCTSHWVVETRTIWLVIDYQFALTVFEPLCIFITFWYIICILLVLNRFIILHINPNILVNDGNGLYQGQNVFLISITMSRQFLSYRVELISFSLANLLHDYLSGISSYYTHFPSH